MSEHRAHVWVMAARPKTLPVAFAPIIVGSAMAWDDDGFHFLSMVIATLCATLITIGTNFCNDFSDFAKGADTDERKGPTRVTQSGLIQSQTMKIATLIVFGLAVCLGMVLVYRGGWIILLIGMISILAGIFYTAGPWPFGYKGLGDVFVLIFFGPVAVGGTYYVQTLELSIHVLMAGFTTGLLATAILVVNNIRDIEEDRVSRKMTLVVRFGRRFGVGLWAFCIVMASVLPLFLIVQSNDHIWSALAALVLIPAIPLFLTLTQQSDPFRLNPILGKTAFLLLSHSVLFSTGWILS